MTLSDHITYCRTLPDHWALRGLQSPWAATPLLWWKDSHTSYPFPASSSWMPDPSQIKWSRLIEDFGILLTTEYQTHRVSRPHSPLPWQRQIRAKGRCYASTLNTTGAPTLRPSRATGLQTHALPRGVYCYLSDCHVHPTGCSLNSTSTRGKNVLDKVFTTIKHTYRAILYPCSWYQHSPPKEKKSTHGQGPLKLCMMAPLSS